MKKDDFKHLNLPEPTSAKTVYYMENGSVLNDEQFLQLIQQHKAELRKPPIVCSKHIYNTSTNINSFFILSANSQFFNPYETDSRYRIRNRWKMVRVKKSIHELYVRFLKTKHKVFLHQAERGI